MRPTWKGCRGKTTGTTKQRGTPASCGALGGLFAAELAGAATFKTSLDRETVILGESVTLTFSLKACKPAGCRNCRPFRGCNHRGHFVRFQLDDRTGPENQIVQTFAVPFITEQVGDIVIPGFNLEVAGQKFSSAPLTLKVLREDPEQPAGRGIPTNRFFWLAMPKKELFLGEILVAEARLYLRSEIGNISDLNLPTVTGEGYNAGPLNRGRRNSSVAWVTRHTMFCHSPSLTPVKVAT